MQRQIFEYYIVHTTIIYMTCMYLCVYVFMYAHIDMHVCAVKKKFINMIYKFEQTIVNIISRMLLMIILRHLLEEI